LSKDWRTTPSTAYRRERRAQDDLLVSASSTSPGKFLLDEAVHLLVGNEKQDVVERVLLDADVAPALELLDPVFDVALEILPELGALVLAARVAGIFSQCRAGTSRPC